MHDLRKHMEARLERMVGLLSELVSLESPTTDKAAVDRLGTFVAEKMEGLGARVEAAPQTVFGNHLRAVWEAPKAERGQVLILCHMDTVWPVGEVARRPLRLEDGKLYGPGVHDMKAGITIAYFALAGLRTLGRWPSRRIVAIFNTDEEVGSNTSRALIEDEAKRSDYVFCLEPSISPTGALKTERPGVGMFVVKVKGRASHAGADHARGISAVEELAHQILKLHSLTDYSVSTTVNVGVIRGGSRSNVVAPEAEAEVDLRVRTMKEAERVVPEILGLKPVLPGATVSVTGGLNRPPMERTPKIVSLFQRAQGVAAQMDLELCEGYTGGGSDGNITAALGIPTLDGLGGRGDGGHAIDEHTIIASLPERAALVAGLLLALP